MSWGWALQELNDVRLAAVRGEPPPPPKPCPHCDQWAATRWHRTKGPEPVLRKRRGLDRWQALPCWVDHPYRVRLKDGRWCYIAEPCLAESGFEVTVSAEVARHLPGRTIAVLIAQTLPAARS